MPYKTPMYDDNQEDIQLFSNLLTEKNSENEEERKESKRQSPNPTHINNLFKSNPEPVSKSVIFP